jgi:hypothetical protein
MGPRANRGVSHEIRLSHEQPLSAHECLCTTHNSGAAAVCYGARQGTAKQHVTDDYAARLAAGAAEAEQLVNQVLGGLLSATTPDDAASHTTTARSAATATARRLLSDDGTTGIADGSAAADSEPATHGVTQLLQCPLLNVSVCDATDRPPPADDRTALLVMAYNPLAWQRRDVVRVPVRSAFQVRNTFTSSEVELGWLTHTTRHLP